MTNLIEKALLLGFSIFLLTIFSSILIPFLNEMTDFNKRGNNDFDSYTVLFYEIDSAVIYVIKNPEELYQKEIKYPSDLNITFIENFLIYDFTLGDDKFSKVLIYNTSFLNCFFYNMTPQIYLLTVSYAFSYIIVDFINLY